MLRLVYEFLWAVIPPILLLIYYYYRISTAPSLLLLLLLFFCGAVSGMLALGLEWAFEIVANWIVDWQKIQRCLTANTYLLMIGGVVFRQLIEVATIEEGCKLAAVILPCYYLQRCYRLRSSSVFLFTIAVALGFTAQENWVYFFLGDTPIVDRLIGTPVHAMFSAPWGYALGVYIGSNIRLHNRDVACYVSIFVLKAWLYAVFNHALVNILSTAGSCPTPLRFLSYGLFPFLLWMFWRLGQLLRRLQGKSTIILLSHRTRKLLYWQQILVIIALILGGNAIQGMFFLTKHLISLNPLWLFYPDVLKFIFSHLGLNLLFGLMAWLIYRYLRHSSRQYFR